MSQSVYLLIYRPSFYDAPEIVGVYSTRALAGARADGYGYEVAEMALDARREEGVGLPFEEVPWERAPAPPLVAHSHLERVLLAAATALDGLPGFVAPTPGQVADFGLGERSAATPAREGRS